jgi:hypothetical protein
LVLATAAAFYIPPKPDQAFLQGATFVFMGPRTVFAHYDPSTAAHASIDEVIGVVDGNRPALPSP